jgi:hypothetical protein
MAESAPGSSRQRETDGEGENGSASGERSGDGRQGGTEALPRVKSVLFHAIMWAIVTLPLTAAVVLVSVSLITYDILQHPERHQSARRVWDVIATDLYYLYGANLWQNQKDCVQYDDRLLYKPSSGCRFVNKEFSTDLTFSEDGRLTDSTLTSASGRPLFFAGDSDTMGWGVNDDETFPALIASRVEVPVLNLGVASYGTVREVMRVRMHPRFQEANCIVYQYSWNDFDENSVFLAMGALPPPTPEKFEALLGDYGKRKIGIQDVMLQAFDFLVNHPLATVASIFGWHEFPLEDDDPLNESGGTPREEAEDAKAFLAVLGSFPEMDAKKVFVIGPPRFISALIREPLPENILPLSVDLKDTDWYPLDKHPNKQGHREIAAQVLEQLQQTEQGRHCLAGEP